MSELDMSKDDRYKLMQGGPRRMTKLDKGVSDKTSKQALLAEFARLMPEEWVSRYWNRSVESGEVQLSVCDVRLESDLLEAPVIIAILDWLIKFGYEASLGTYDVEDSMESTLRLTHYLGYKGPDFTAPTRIECAVKAFCYVAGLK